MSACRATPAALALALGLLWWLPAAAQMPPHCGALGTLAERSRCVEASRRAASSPFSGGCSSLSDPTARIECLGRAQTGGTPNRLLSREAPRCTLATPCSDRRGRYYLTSAGAKRYF